MNPDIRHWEVFQNHIIKITAISLRWPRVQIQVYQVREMLIISPIIYFNVRHTGSSYNLSSATRDYGHTHTYPYATQSTTRFSYGIARVGANQGRYSMTKTLSLLESSALYATTKWQVNPTSGLTNNVEKSKAWRANKKRMNGRNNKQVHSCVPFSSICREQYTLRMLGFMIARAISLKRIFLD